MAPALQKRFLEQNFQLQTPPPQKKICHISAYDSATERVVIATNNCSSIYIVIPVADSGFPLVRGANPPGWSLTYDFDIFSYNLHKI